MSLCSISHLIWHICSLTIIDATVLSSLWSVPFQLQVSLIRSSEYALGFLDLSQGLRVLRGIPGSLRQLTKVLSQNLAVKTSRKPSTVEETLGFHAMIPLFFYRTHSTDLLTGALQLTSLRRGEVPKVSITWDTLAPRRWWHEDFTCWVRNSGSLYVAFSEHQSAKRNDIWWWKHIACNKAPLHWQHDNARQKRITKDWRYSKTRVNRLMRPKRTDCGQLKVRVSGFPYYSNTSKLVVSMSQSKEMYKKWLIRILIGLHATPTMFCHLQVILAVIWDACDSDVSALLAWDASTSSLFWERSFENTLQSLCKDDHHIFAGSVLDNENSITHCVLDVCCSFVVLFVLRFIMSWHPGKEDGFTGDQTCS